MLLILTGPPAAGKNAVGRSLARHIQRCALIDVDQVRQMVVQGHVPPWAGAAGREQKLLGVANACLLAESFMDGGYEVVLLDVVDDETAALYRHRLAVGKLVIVMLLPDAAEIERRNSRRPVLSPTEVAMLDAQQRDFDGYDLKIDNTSLSPEQAADRLAGWLGLAN
jgi:predicted kinase